MKESEEEGCRRDLGSSFGPRSGMRGTEWRQGCDLEKRVSEKWGRVRAMWIQVKRGLGGSPSSVAPCPTEQE